MATIKAKQIPKAKKSESDSLELLALLCYYYPQYTLEQARKLPYRHVKLLLHTARRQRAMEFLTLTQISTAPHTKKMSGVKKLMKYFKEQIDG